VAGYADMTGRAASTGRPLVDRRHPIQDPYPVGDHHQTVAPQRDRQDNRTQVIVA
jgi:hypothetical protein